MFTSPKTTILGISALLTALGAAGTAWANGQPVDYAGLIPAVIAGIGLIFARDNAVTSERAGAK